MTIVEWITVLAIGILLAGAVGILGSILVVEIFEKWDKEDENE